MSATESPLVKITPRKWGWLLELRTAPASKFFALLPHPGESGLVSAVPTSGNLRDSAVSSLLHLSEKARVYESINHAAASLSTHSAEENRH
jgi:hypothetical protein